MNEPMVSTLLIIVVSAPLVMLGVLGMSMLVGRPLAESVTSLLAHATILVGIVSSIGTLGVMWTHSYQELTITLGNWVSIPHYHFTVEFLFDRLSVPLVLLSYILHGVICVFAGQYMHREPGYHRFFLLYAVFLTGIVIAFLAGTVETLFAGWELVGLSSALLVAFFHERPAPVRNGLGVWTFYRISDAALLVAAVLLHHWTGTGEFHRLFGSTPWPTDHSSLSWAHAIVVGGLLLVAAAGKSALVPFSGWLPRAMEGPTPSSAIFYGALSVHLGAYLLLRISPIIETSALLSAAVIMLGLMTSLYASIAGRVHADIKATLAYASLTQLGIIVAEIGLGLRFIPLVHIIGHVSVRTLQFLRAPTLLRDLKTMENAVGTHLPRMKTGLWHLLPDRAQILLYRFGLERGFLDALLRDYIVHPALWMFGASDALERRWIALLSNLGRHTEPQAPKTGEVLEDLV